MKYSVRVDWLSISSVDFLCQYLNLVMSQNKKLGLVQCHHEFINPSADQSLVRLHFYGVPGMEH